MKNKKLIALATLCVFTFSKESIAKDYDDRLYIAPSASYNWLDDDRNTTRNGHGFNLGLGKAISEDINLELKGTYNRFAHHESKAAGGDDHWDTFALTLDTQYYFSREEIAPYLVAGVGFMDSNQNGRNAVGLVGELGAGVAYALNDNLSLRSDVRYRYNNNFNRQVASNTSDEYNDLVVNVGLVIPFGQKEREEVRKVEEVPAQIDNDLDKDGVVNALDKCPDTPKGEKVNQIGCKKGVELVDVGFELNSAKLKLSAQLALNKVAKDLIEDSDGKALEIHGHSSSEGSAKYNQILSQKRAQSVVDYLKKQGVENKMTARGYGEDRLLYDESQPNGREKNRRVELVWE